MANEPKLHTHVALKTIIATGPNNERIEVKAGRQFTPANAAEGKRLVERKSARLVAKDDAREASGAGGSKPAGNDGGNAGNDGGNAGNDKK